MEGHLVRRLGRDLPDVFFLLGREIEAGEGQQLSGQPHRRQGQVLVSDPQQSVRVASLHPVSRRQVLPDAKAVAAGVLLHRALRDDVFLVPRHPRVHRPARVPQQVNDLDLGVLGHQGHGLGHGVADGLEDHDGGVGAGALQPWKTLRNGFGFGVVVVVVSQAPLEGSRLEPQPLKRAGEDPPVSLLEAAV